jgi:hypothetical protein
METAYSPMNNNHNIQRIIYPKKSIKKDKFKINGIRMIKDTHINGKKILRKFIGYII